MVTKQMLLLVLAVVLVGVAVVAGIEVFEQYAATAGSDAERGADVSGSIEQAMD